MYLTTENGRRLTTEGGRYLVTRLVARLFPTAFRLVATALGLDPTRTALLPPEPTATPRVDPDRTTLLEL